MADSRRPAGVPATGRLLAPREPIAPPSRAVRWGSILSSLGILAWAIAELANLVVNHTMGPELYGVLVALLAVAAGLANVILMRLPRSNALVVVAVLVVWSVVAVGGVAGTIAHIVGPVAGEGPADPRLRPVAAPLVFTLLGLVGGLTLFVAGNPALRGLRDLWKD